MFVRPTVWELRFYGCWHPCFNENPVYEFIILFVCLIVFIGQITYNITEQLTTSPLRNGTKHNSNAFLKVWLGKVKSGKCHVWRHKNISKKEGWEEKGERKPLEKRWIIDVVFLTSHLTHSAVTWQIKGKKYF